MKILERAKKKNLEKSQVFQSHVDNKKIWRNMNSEMRSECVTNKQITLFYIYTYMKRIFAFRHYDRFWSHVGYEKKKKKELEKGKKKQKTQRAKKGKS